MNILISKKIKQIIPTTKLGIITAKIAFTKENPQLTERIKYEVKQIQNNLKLEDIKKLSPISTTRAAYRALGKEPARYRPSAEALLRRIIQGKNLYQINNIVDTINLASIITAFSIGGYDLDKIEGNITFDLGRKNEKYQAIGRGLINIENLPVFRDSTGAFGSPTTDSERTKITEKTTKVLLIVINFGDIENFDKTLENIKGLLEDYVNAENCTRTIIE